MFGEHAPKTDRDQRAIEVKAFGNTPEELELDALDEAREFFGSDPLLEVQKDYTAKKPLGFENQNTAALRGTTYMAFVRVRIAER